MKTYCFAFLVFISFCVILSIKAENSSEHWKSECESYFSKGNYTAAIDCYNKSIEKNKMDSEAWYSKAIALCKIGNDEEAKKCWDMAINLNASFAFRNLSQDCHPGGIFGVIIGHNESSL